MTDPIERYSVDSLLAPELGARVLRQRLRWVDVHWHDYYELSLVLSGEAEHVVNGETRRIGPGSAFLLSPADLQSISAVGSEPLVCSNTVIDAALMERQLAGLGAPALDGFPWFVDDFRDAAADFERLHREFDEPRVGSARVTEALVACLVVEMARRRGLDDQRGDRPSGRDDDVRAAVLYLDRHFREPLTLADVAARAHLSPNYFSQQFRQYTGTSFQGYLQERRLRFARSLLAATPLSVTEACHAAGFNSLSHFGRAYRRRYGVAPSARTATG